MHRSPKTVSRFLAVAGPAELTPTAIAHYLGPPVTAAIVRDLMRHRTDLRHQPEALADLFASARRIGEAQRRQPQEQETQDG